MKTLSGIKNLEGPLKSSVVTIGNYDGVHLGHREILSRVVKLSNSADVSSVVMTFSPHPREVLTPDKPFSRIFHQRDQVEQLEEMGVDYFVVEPFSRELSNIPADRFLSDWIVKPFSPKTIVVGYDFSFGANREGSLDFLKKSSHALGYELEIVPPYKIDGEVASSTKVRNYLTQGKVSFAAKLLGRLFYLRGVVIKGDGRGKSIGVPTANIRTPATLLPQSGVYATRTVVDGVARNSVTNIGRNPTFTAGGNQPNKVESYIFDFDQDIYGEEIRIEFCERIRDELRFDSVDRLVTQIKEDAEKAKEILKAYDNRPDKELG